jgi:hypothetical protein
LVLAVLLLDLRKSLALELVLAGSERFSSLPTPAPVTTTATA